MRRLFVALAVVSCSLSLFIVSAQSRLTFEVASIKQVDTTLPNGIRGWSCTGTDGGPAHPLILAALGRCRVVGQSLKKMLSLTYGVPEDRIVGASGWMESLPYTIEAKAESPASMKRPQLVEMLINLLTDRFKVKFHRESKEVPGYILIVAESGPKLKEPSANETRRGSVSGVGTFSGLTSAAGIAGTVARDLGVPVIDNTGLMGRYIVDFKWTPENQRGVDAINQGPSIFTALQEQLGLRLVPKLTTIELFVIDSAEKPTEN